MILVDTSVWVDHLAHGEPDLTAELSAGQVLTHPFIIGEIACGNLRNRRQVLGMLQSLPKIRSATDAETLAFVEGRRLMGRGIGYIDVHLLASAVLSAPATLWTRDRRLAAVASELSLGDPHR